MTPTKAVKQKSCNVCKAKFSPKSSLQKVCGLFCAAEYGNFLRSKNAQRKKAEEARKDRKKREAMKTHPQLIKEAQREFNRFIRLRDIGRSCICCGVPLGEAVLGGAADAGHYRSVGSAPNLRYNEDNCHSQSKRCNRYGAGRAVDYRIGLVARIGLERVEALEADNTPKHYTKDELRNIRDTYRIKAREMEKQHGTP